MAAVGIRNPYPVGGAGTAVGLVAAPSRRKRRAGPFLPSGAAGLDPEGKKSDLGDLRNARSGLTPDSDVNPISLGAARRDQVYPAGWGPKFSPPRRAPGTACPPANWGFRKRRRPP